MTGVLPIQGRRFASIRLQVADGLGYFFCRHFLASAIYPKKYLKKTLHVKGPKRTKQKSPDSMPGLIFMKLLDI